MYSPRNESDASRRRRETRSREGLAFRDYPEKRFVQGSAAFHQCPILPVVVYTTCIYGELMVNNQQYDSHEGRFDTSFARVFHS